MATPNPFLTVTHAQWMERTKVSGFARRHSDLRAIDDLYKQAWADIRFTHRKPYLYGTLSALKAAFEKYLKERNVGKDFKGPDGKDLNRNQLSGGLLKQTYDFVCEELLKFNEAQAPAASTMLVNDARHARAGVLYLLGHTRAETNFWSVASDAATLAAGAAGVGTASTDKIWEKQKVGELTVGDPIAKIHSATQLGLTIGAHATGGPASHPSVGLSDKILSMVKGLLSRVQEYLQIRDASFYTNVGKLLRIATDFVLDLITKAAPMVGAVMDIGQGFLKACTAAINYLGTRRKARQFVLVRGHPEILAHTLQDAMKYDIVAGLFQICKGAVSAAFGAVTAGVASLIADGVVAVVKFFRRYLETCKIQTFLRKAEAELQRIQNGKTVYDLGNAEANSGKSFSKVLDDPERFREFYQEGANASVCIPILTLNSGICGDLMQMVRMYDDDDARITQQSFDAATGYFANLKLWGCQHIKGSGISFKSNYRNVGNLLNHAINGHHGTQSTMQKVVTTLAA